MAELKWTPEKVARYWDHLSSSRGDWYFSLKYGDSILAHLERFARRGCAVLDYGGGSGALVPKLLGRGYAVAAVDVSSESVRSVSGKFEGEKNFLGSFDSNRIEDIGRTFDIVLMVELVEHLYDEQLESVLEGMRKSLSPGGILFITTPNDEDLSEDTVYCPECGHTYHAWQHVRSWTEGGLSLYLEKRGYRVSRIYTADFSHSVRQNGLALYLMKHIVNLARKWTNTGPRRRLHIVCVCSPV